MEKEHIFELEQNILDCWNITKEIETLTEAVLETDISVDDISNVLIGLEKLYNIKFNKLFSTFEQHTKSYYKFKKSI